MSNKPRVAIVGHVSAQIIDLLDSWDDHLPLSDIARLLSLDWRHARRQVLGMRRAGLVSAVRNVETNDYIVSLAQRAAEYLGKTPVDVEAVARVVPNCVWQLSTKALVMRGEFDRV